MMTRSVRQEKNVQIQDKMAKIIKPKVMSEFFNINLSFLKQNDSLYILNLFIYLLKIYFH